MKIVLTESQINALVKSEVDEALGVPANMLPETKKLITHVYDILSDIVYGRDSTFDSLTQPGGYQERLDLKMNIGGKYLDNILMLVTFTPVDKINRIRINSAGYAPEFTALGRTGEIDRSGRQVLLYRFEIPKIYGNIKDHDDSQFKIPKIYDHDDFQNKVMSDLNSDKVRADISRVTAHELKHMLDKAFGHDKQPKNVIQYTGFSKNMFKRGMHDSISHLMFASYYTHIVETMVRAVEVLESAQSAGVTKKTFTRFLKTYSPFENLVHFKDMTYDKFITALKVNHFDAFRLLSSNNAFDEQEAMQGILDSIKEAQQRTLESLIIVTKQNLKKIFKHYDPDRIDKMFNDTYGEIVAKINSDLKLNNPNQNPRLFVQKLIRNIVFNADKGMRKIARVYDLLPD
jgi:hypothetical protein